MDFLDNPDDPYIVKETRYFLEHVELLVSKIEK